MSLIFRRYMSVLPDGRTSLKQKISSVNYKSFKEKWLCDPSTYPIIGIISVASVCASGFGINFLLTSPDVCILKK